MARVGMSFLDYSGEVGKTDFYMADSTALNIAGQLDDINPTHAGSVAEAICALSLCTCVVTSLEAQKNSFAQNAPASQYAQRELGLLVTYEDTVNHHVYRMTIPGPNWATIGLAGSDQVNPANAAWTAFVTVFEANCLSKDGNAVNVLSGRLVGRNR